MLGVRGHLLLWSWAPSPHPTDPALLLPPQESLFPARVVYDLLFFFIVIIIVLNLIFGVIIDTFADLRSEKQKKEEVLKTTCFICGEATLLHRPSWVPVAPGSLSWADGSAALGPELGRAGPCRNVES